QHQARLQIEKEVSRGFEYQVKQLIDDHEALLIHTAWQPRVKNFSVTKVSPKKFSPTTCLGEKGENFSRRKFPAIRYTIYFVCTQCNAVYATMVS
ncbi:MAG: hypothetical protein MJE68_12530, partial [Proteobacteria bacterium]|nr:hypothetical protein [Pseudomonadota bacterium]